MTITRYYVDTEFIEDGRTIDLLSIAVVSSDGRELYLENSDADMSKAHPWVIANVLPHLWRPRENDESCDFLTDPETIAFQVRQFVNATSPHTGQVEFWGYYSDYDWVALCQLYGPMVELPPGWPMFCYDLRQALNHHGLQASSQPNDMPHHALSDARWIATTHKLLLDRTGQS